MNVLAHIFVFAFVAFLFYAVFSLVRFVYVRLKAYIIRRRLVKRSETEQKDD